MQSVTIHLAQLNLMTPGNKAGIEINVSRINGNKNTREIQEYRVMNMFSD